MPDATHARLIMPGGIAHPVIPVAYPPSTLLIFRRSDKALTPHPTMRADATHVRFIMPGVLRISHPAIFIAYPKSAINTLDLRW